MIGPFPGQNRPDRDIRLHKGHRDIQRHPRPKTQLFNDVLDIEKGFKGGDNRSNLNSLTSLIASGRSTRIEGFFKWALRIVVETFLVEHARSKGVVEFLHKPLLTITARKTVSIGRTHRVKFG